MNSVAEIAATDETPVGTSAGRRLSAPSRFAERFIVTYKTRVSHRLNSSCRLEPSCSEYALASYRKHDFIRATAKTVWRLARCNPLTKRGRIDLP